MKHIRKLNCKGFGHVEMFVTVLLIAGITAIGLYVKGISHGLANTSTGYASLASIKFNNQTYREKVCAVSVNDGYYILNAVVYTSGQPGDIVVPEPGTPAPQVLYKINSPVPYVVAYSNWTTSSTNTTTLINDMPEATGATTFNIGIRGVINGKQTVVWGSTNGQPYTTQSIPLCSSSTTVTPADEDTCNQTMPTQSPDPTYTMVGQPVDFMNATSTVKNLWQDYGNGIQSPGGYVAASHAVFVPGLGLQIRGYTDPISKKAGVGGVTGGSGDVNVPINGSGGFDACIYMTGGNWQNVSFELVSWSTSTGPTAWNQGELDIFEGSPAHPGINLHEIGPYPAFNVWQSGWPSVINDGGVHLLSARWDPVNGYRFYLDGNLVHTLVNNCLSASDPNYTPQCVQPPTTPHHLSIQMRDTKQNSTSRENATVYWTASYNYNP